jgi:hypothetical protein
MSRTDTFRITEPKLVADETNWAPGGANFTTTGFDLHSPYVGYMIDYTQGTAAETSLTIQVQASTDGMDGSNYESGSHANTISLWNLGGAPLTASEQHWSTLTLGDSGAWAPVVGSPCRFRLVVNANTAADSVLKIWIVEALLA